LSMKQQSFSSATAVKFRNGGPEAAAELIKCYIQGSVQMYSIYVNTYRIQSQLQSSVAYCLYYICIYIALYTVYQEFSSRLRVY
jgi:hypothetical protein